MKCPFRNFESCSKDCALFSMEERKYSHKIDSVKVEGCVFILILEELINHSGQNSMIHSQTGEVANNIIYQALTMFGSEEGAKLLKKKAQHLISQDTN